MRSDTVTMPTQAMRRAMSLAEVGDDVFGEDPTVLQLEKLGAKLTGKEACVFVSTGTQGNLASLMAHCDRRGCEIIVGDKQHIYLHEQGGTATLAGIHSRVLRNNDDGTMDVDEIERAIRPCDWIDADDAHYPRTAVVAIENTHNMCGGVPISLNYMSKLKERIKGRKVKFHLDGARAGNAAVALGVSLKELCNDVDSISLCLSKGLGAPVGTLVAGDENFALRVRRAKKALGGGWRQAGVLAAAGIIAMETMQETLSRDHKLAAMFAENIKNVSGVKFSRMPQTNLVFFEVSTMGLDKFAAKAEEKGLLINYGYGKEGKAVRAAIHRDLSVEDVEMAASIIKDILMS